VAPLFVSTMKIFL